MSNYQNHQQDPYGQDPYGQEPQEPTGKKTMRQKWHDASGAQKFGTIAGGAVAIAIIASIGGTSSSDDNSSNTAATNSQTPTHQNNSDTNTDNNGSSDTSDNSSLTGDDKLKATAVKVTLQQDGVEVHGLDNIDTMAHEVCRLVDNGHTPESVAIGVAASDNNPYTPEETGKIVGAALGAYCPENAPHNTYGA